MPSGTLFNETVTLERKFNARDASGAPTVDFRVLSEYQNLVASVQGLSVSEQTQLRQRWGVVDHAVYLETEVLWKRGDRFRDSRNRLYRIRGSIDMGGRRRLWRYDCKFLPE